MTDRVTLLNQLDEEHDIALENLNIKHLTKPLEEHNRLHDCNLYQDIVFRILDLQKAEQDRRALIAGVPYAYICDIPPADRILDDNEY